MDFSATKRGLTRQESRSPKGEPTEDVISKEDAVKLVKEIDVEEVEESSFFDIFKSEGEDDGEHGEG